MDQSSLRTDEDQDSLFGSPPPSPARGRSPTEETSIGEEQGGRVVAVPSTGVGRKNVGTIALPGSHMACAELPADLPAPRLSVPRSTSSQDSRCSVAGTPSSPHTPVVASRSPLPPVSSRASSAGNTIPPASTFASIKKRRMPKAKSLAPAPPPPIALPGPDEPTPTNFLRSQSSLLGLAGLVGCVKPAQLYAQGPQPTPTRQRSPICGSTAAHPIVLDDDQNPSHVGERSQMPQCLDQLNPDIFRSNFMSSLTKEKNIFPVLESLIKLLGGEPNLSSANPLFPPFARPYGCGIFKTQSSPVTAPTAPDESTTPTIPPKRRKLKHVPAGAVDWDVPFPFAAGEGPERYRDTWAQDRAKQLVTQLLELVRDATKRAAIKTTKDRGNASEDRAMAQNCQLFRNASVETLPRQTQSTRTGTCTPPSHANRNSECTTTGTPSNVAPVGSQHRFLGPPELPSTVDSPALSPKDRTSIGDSEGVAEACSSAPCDYSAFEEWLSQLQQLVPFETSAPPSESDEDTPLDSLVSDLASSTRTSTHCHPMPEAVRDEAIDPILLALSQLGGSTSRSQSPTLPTSTLASGDVSHAVDTRSTPILTHSPRTSLSSLTEPLTPLSEAFVDPPSSIVHRDHDCDPPIDLATDQGHYSRALLTKHFEPPCITQAQKGKARADTSVTSATPSTSSRPPPSVVSTSKDVLDKQAILERARERRRQLMTELERARVEIWETSIENAVLVHLTRDGSLRS